MKKLEIIFCRNFCKDIKITTINFQNLTHSISNQIKKRQAKTPKATRYSLRHVNLIRDEIYNSVSEDESLESEESDLETTSVAKSADKQEDQAYNYENTDNYFKAMHSKSKSSSKNTLNELDKLDAYELSNY